MPPQTPQFTPQQSQQFSALSASLTSLSDILRRYQSQGYTNLSQVPQIPQTLTSANLQTTPNLTVPQVSSPIAATGFQGFLQTFLANQQARNTREQEATAKATEAAEARKTEIEKTQLALGEIPAKQAQLEAEAGIAGKTQKVTDYTNQIEAEQRALQKQIEQMEKNPQGISRGAMESEIARVTRESVTKQADLALLQSAANRDLTTAQSIIDKKIETITEPLKLKLEFDKFFYEDNKEALSKAEQREFQTIQTQDERAYKFIFDELDKIHKTYATAVEHNAPDTILRSILQSDSSLAASQAAGQYLQDPNAGLDRQYKLGQISLQEAQLRKLNSEIKEMGTPEITNLNAGQYSQALSVILGSGKFTKDQKASVVSAINNGEDPVTVIKNQAKNIMGQTLATDLDKYETARDQLNNIDTLLKDYYTNGGKTGIFTGSLEKVTNKLGEVNDPNLVEIATNIAAALQIYRNAVSGTAYSVQEGKDIASIFPGINKSQGLNQAILSGRMKAFETTIDAKYRNTLGSAYDALKPKPQPSVNPFIQSLSNIFNPQTGLFNIPD